VFAWKYRIHAICILSVLAIIFVPLITNRPDKHKVEAAATAAQEFLTMVDAGKYADSWQISAAYLKKQIPQQDWEAKLGKIRATLGPLAERQLEDASYTASAEELPETEFILLEFDSQFKLKEMTEVVTVLQDTDNSWRVVGYYIQ
jgi:ribonucleotide monophosphatase NagD (HAD superfamily)